MWPLKPSFGLGVGEVSVLHNASVNVVADYDTFSVEARHPAEVLAEEGGHLVQWHSTRLQRPLTAPDLTARGFRLMGGRVLPTANAPAAQLMYDRTVRIAT